MNIGSLLNGGDYMPGFDGTGPVGQGPLTGGGRGFCVVPLKNNARISYGVAGLQNYSVNFFNPNSQAYNNFYSSSYKYLLYQLRSFGYSGRSAGCFRGRGGRSFLKGIDRKGRNRKF